MARDPFGRSPLFRNAPKAVQESLRRDFRRSPVGRLLSSVERSNVPTGVVGSALSYLKAGGSTSGAVKRLAGSQLGPIVAEVEKYSRQRDRGDKKLLDLFLSQLGPAGSLIRALIGGLGVGEPARRSKLTRELETAKRLLEAFGHRVIKPPEQMTPLEFKQAADLMRGRLEEMGYGVVAPGEEPAANTGRGRLPHGISPTTRSGEQRRVIDITLAGRRRRFRVDDPIVTGEMIRTPGSSNVYGFAYDLDHQILYVRFKAPARDPGKGRPNEPGPLYQYRNVAPHQFEALQRAGSKGAWVWDNLRIRGTVSGHRYDYALVGITGGYVPRKATVVPGGEAFLRRRVHVGRGNELVSSLPDEIVRTFGAPRRPRDGSPRRPRS